MSKRSKKDRRAGRRGPDEVAVVEIAPGFVLHLHAATPASVEYLARRLRQGELQGVDGDELLRLLSGN